MATVAVQPDHRIDAVRRFNRFYTRQIGVLGEGLLDSQFSLTEVRVLFELAHADHPTARQISELLGLDPGYLSRILRGFQARGLVCGIKSQGDARQTLLSLTTKGRETFAVLNDRANEEIAAMLRKLSAAEQSSLLGSMQTIEELLSGEAPQRAPYLLRSYRPGDMGWIIARHGALYAQEYGYDEQFEAVVAEIASNFLKHHDPRREHCWIAERNDQNVGSVMLVRKSNTVAKLRLLIVEPSARGLGIGKRLVEECIRFARHAGYKKITLWTHGQLAAARGIYKAAGFSRAAAVPSHSFGKDLVDETWELTF